jgi:hypothetical protein
MPFNIQRTQKVLGTSKTIYYVSPHNWTDKHASRAVFTDRASAEAIIPAEVWGDCVVTEE